MIVDESGTVAHPALDIGMVHRALIAGPVGTSVFRGIEGFRAAERLGAFLPDLEDVVHVVHHAGRPLG